MAKKKSKKSSKKKSQKKQKKQQKEEKNELLEVDKELYEIQITDLNGKLKRLNEQCADLQAENVAIKETLAQLDEDRADVIAYLKQILKSKVDEIADLLDKVNALQQTREQENVEFLDKFGNKENQLQKMKEQLTTEINLLNGKLNVLDEFRAQREDLMKQFQIQEEAQKHQEVRHQETLHNIEKGFILKKLYLKKEVEERLIKLSEDFQTMMQSKIDSTTKTAIIENSALRNEMNKIMETCKELIRENTDLKSSDRLLKIKHTSLKEELDESIRKYNRQKQALQASMLENEQLKITISKLDSDSHLKKIQDLNKKLDICKINLKKQITINEELENKVNCWQARENDLNKKLSETTIRLENIEKVIQNAATVIKNAVLLIQTTYRTRSQTIPHQLRHLAADSSLILVIPAATLTATSNNFRQSASCIYRKHSKKLRSIVCQHVVPKRLWHLEATDPNDFEQKA
ncbi:hypothetical protein V9T40_000107 [Parthenolecanium corni]|uniref:Cilia- and flagella-associated protein 157 n=1 Tax=Parthenolecanium corni TaxID=536013 RepID=A0AAN9TFW8_9HEMI